jgi:carbohydrate-binding DOMON domain-containing protein
VFDLERFAVAQDEKDLVFTFQTCGPIANVWGSGINLSLQTFDIYIDVDPGTGRGARRLLEGRNAALPEGYGWDYAVWVEGWHQKVLRPDQAGRPVELPGTPVKVIVNAAKRTVVVRVARQLFGNDPDPASWSYVGLLLSQEGYPSAGVRRVRDVKPEAEQWRIGGGPTDTNHTRILDVAWPPGQKPTQEEFLGDYPPSQQKNLDLLGPDELPSVPMVRAP